MARKKKSKEIEEIVEVEVAEPSAPSIEISLRPHDLKNTLVDILNRIEALEKK